jgi:hypothetical protein
VKQPEKKKVKFLMITIPGQTKSASCLMYELKIIYSVNLLGLLGTKSANIN